ncbi:MAG: hypothetical protein J2P38_11690 [Candidatus Dormibacteraeota bacterium]|nr:hypothetical protein [Candidatus Dormibacteraeota bacterium]
MITILPCAGAQTESRRGRHGGAVMIPGAVTPAELAVPGVAAAVLLVLSLAGALLFFVLAVIDILNAVERRQ